MNPAVVLLGRIFLSILFIVAGFGKLTGAAGFAGALGGMGFPAPLLMAYLVGALEFFGGLAILVGLQTRVAAYALAAFTVGTILVAHMGEMQPAMKNLAIAGGFLALAVAGPGAYSIDARRRGGVLAHA